MQAWLRAVLRGEHFVPVEGDSRFPYRGISLAKRTDPKLGAYVERHVAAIERVLAGDAPPHWLMTRWREHHVTTMRPKP